MPIITECKDCIFAKNKEDYLNGDVEQLDCVAGRLDTFDKLGKTQFVWNQDEKRGFYKIDGICNLKTLNKPPEQSTSDALEYAKFRVNNIFDLIVYCNDRNSEDLKDTIDSAHKQSPGFHKTRILVNSKRYTKINKTCLTNYIVHRLPEREKILVSLDVVLGQIENPGLFYCFVESGTILPDSLLFEISHYMNEMCLPLSCVYSPSFLVMSVYWHKKMGGSFGGNIFKKIKTVYHSDPSNQKYILEYGELHEKVSGDISRRTQQKNANTISKNPL